MSIRNSKLVKVDIEWEKKMRDIMKERYDKKLANLNLRELGMPEATRLTLRCPSWGNVEKELRNLPKKRT
jgi:hypothetical protein